MPAMIAETKGKADTVAPERVGPEQSAASPIALGSRRPWQGLLWCEWFSHGKLLLGFLVLWLAAVWILPLVTHSGWILFIAAIYALVAGPAYGGGDTIEGCEEFSFSLPAT